MRFSVHASGRTASFGIQKATIEGAVETAMSLMPSGVRIEDHATRKVYRDSEIVELEKLLRR